MAARTGLTTAHTATTLDARVPVAGPVPTACTCDSALLDSASLTVRIAPGSFETGMTIPLRSMSRMKPALATASVISGRNCQPSTKSNDANAHVANTNAGMATTTSRFGDQPSASEPNTITNA